MQRWKIVALAGGDTHITEPAQRYVYPLFLSSLAEGNIIDII